MRIIKKSDYDELSKAAARIVAQVVQRKPGCVLGLATGSSPLGMYRELVRMHREEGLDFSGVTTFNLDEYVGVPPEHDQSFSYFIQENLFRHINIQAENTHLPDGMAGDVEAYCAGYEAQIEAAGGIDLQVLGIGSNGHLAFNEPGSSLASRTRPVLLTDQTRQDNAHFFASLDEVPTHAISMGLGTIAEARRLLLLANGEKKAQAIHAAIEGPLTAMMPASLVQIHPDVTILVDEAAASLVTRPWLFR